MPTLCLYRTLRKSLKWTWLLCSWKIIVSSFSFFISSISDLHNIYFREWKGKYLGEVVRLNLMISWHQELGLALAPAEDEGQLQSSHRWVLGATGWENRNGVVPTWIPWLGRRCQYRSNAALCDTKSTLAGMFMPRCWVPNESLVCAWWFIQVGIDCLPRAGHHVTSVAP